MSITIYHNPRCSKSRNTLEIIREKGIEPEIIEYLKNPPAPETTLRIAGLLQKHVAELVRTNEAAFNEAEDTLALNDDDAIAAWIHDNPVVLQRPIVVDNEKNRAVIGRPPENVLELLGK
jgi:arsenate reductase